MQVTLQHHSTTRKSIDFTVPAAEVSAEFGKVLEKIAPKAKVPGFRPGKAPKQVLLSRFGHEIQQEVAENLVNRHFLNAAQSAGTQPISQPAMEKIDLQDGADGVFSAHYDVAPEVALPDYKGLALTKRKRLVDAATIDEHLEALRQQAAKFIPVEEAAAEGHFATLDIKVKPQGMKAQEYKDQVIQLQAGRPFDTEILGLKLDEQKTFSIQIPDEEVNKAMAGKSVRYDVVLKDLRARVVPELNDEFAKDMGDYKDLKALRDFLRKDLEEAADRDGTARMHTAMLDMLLDAATFEVPASMVALQLDDYCHEFASTVSRQGIDPRKINWVAYRQSRMHDAERAVRSGYLLQSIGNAEDIQVSDEEIEKEMRAIYDEQKVQQPFEAFKAELERRGAAMEIKGRVRTEKIFERLASFGTIQEELLDKEAYEKVLEQERRREAGLPQARFDAGGLEGGELEGQEGGAPDAVTPAEEAEAASDEPKPKKAAKKEEKAEGAAEKPKKAPAKKAEAAEEKPKKAAPKKAEAAEEKPVKKTAKK